MADPGQRPGLFAALQNVSATLLAMAQTRVALLGNELEVEKLRILRMLLLAQAAMFSATIGALLLVALLTLWLWDFRLGVLALCALLFGGCALLAYRALMRMVQQPERAFAATLAELQDDLRRLKAASGNAISPD